MPNRSEPFRFFDPVELEIPWLVAGGLHRRYNAVQLTEHSHPEGVELTFVFSGAVRWVLADGSALYHPSGTLGVIQRGIRHHGDGNVIAPCGLFWLLIAPERLGEKLFLAQEAESLRSLFEGAGNLVVDGNEFLPVALQRLMQLLRTPETYDFTGRVRMLLHTLLLESAASLELARKRQARQRLDTWKMQQIKDALASDLTRRINLAELAHQHRMTPVELTRRFVRYEKLTPAEFRMRTRLDVAARELRAKPELPIGALALALGFASSQHFANVFKRYYGITPSEHRAAAGT